MKRFHAKALRKLQERPQRGAGFLPARGSSPTVKEGSFSVSRALPHGRATARFRRKENSVAALREFFFDVV